MNIDAEPRRNQGLIANEMIWQIYMPLRILRYFGKSAEISLPAIVFC